MQIDYLAHHRVHIDTLAAWHHAEWAHLYPIETHDDFKEHLICSAQTERIPLTVIALVDNALAGSASLITHDLDTHPELTPWLANVYVHPAFRKRGLATQLIERIMTEARGLGIETLHLFTAHQADFYARLGWRRLSEESYCGEWIIIMVFQRRMLGAPMDRRGDS